MEYQIIRGDTRLIGLVGNPVRHSLSPLIHNHLFRKMNLPFAYVPLQIREPDLHLAMQALRALNFAGANITVPYKSKVLPYCDVLSELSQNTQTVNTLYFKNGLLHGTTTDAQGFFMSLKRMNFDLANAHVVLLGNGGIAQTLGFSLATDQRIGSLCLIGRAPDRVQALAENISITTGYPVRYSFFGSSEARLLLTDCDLLVNCTSAGMHPDIHSSPLPGEWFNQNMTVFDTIYNPKKTLFLKQAQVSGCRTQNGLEMLLYQGLASFQYWTCIDADITLVDLQELESLISPEQARA